MHIQSSDHTSTHPHITETQTNQWPAPTCRGARLPRVNPWAQSWASRAWRSTSHANTPYKIWSHKHLHILKTQPHQWPARTYKLRVDPWALSWASCAWSSTSHVNTLTLQNLITQAPTNHRPISYQHIHVSGHAGSAGILVHLLDPVVELAPLYLLLIGELRRPLPLHHVQQLGVLLAQATHFLLARWRPHPRHQRCQLLLLSVT